MMGVGRKVADCIALFSLDQPQTIPVDTHVFQIAQKFGFVKSKGSKKITLNDKVYEEITEAFKTKYGSKAGWAHQVLFAGDLKSFKDNLFLVSKSKDQASKSVEATNALSNKKRTLDQITPDSGADQDPEVKEPPSKRRKVK
jgi:hypothetical protein